MMNFHKPSIDDYGWIHDILYPANLPGADNTFHNMYFWECYYGEVAEVCGHVTQRLSQNGVSTYLYPAGTGDLAPALEEIMQDAKQRGEKFCLRGVTDDRKTLLESLYPGKFTFTAYRDSYDYIYTVEELTELHCRPSATTATASSRTTPTREPRLARRKISPFAARW